MAALKKWVEPAALAVSDPVYTQHNAMHGLTGDPMTKTRFRRSWLILLESWIPIIGNRYQEGGRVLSRTFFSVGLQFSLHFDCEFEQATFCFSFCYRTCDRLQNTLDLCGEVL